EPYRAPPTGGRRPPGGARGGPRGARPAGAVEAHGARRRPAATGRDLPLLRADDHPVAAVRGRAPARAALGADRDLRDALPAVEHRGAVGPPRPSDGRAHRLHHRGPPGGARGRGQARVQRAHAEGLEVTDEELNAQIQAVPAFQEGGRFVLGRYQEFVRRRGLTAAAFEDEVRREVTRQKIERAVRGGVKVTPAEVEHAFALRREEARAAWALVELGPLIATATASDDELQKYLS